VGTQWTPAGDETGAATGSVVRRRHRRSDVYEHLAPVRPVPARHQPPGSPSVRVVLSATASLFFLAGALCTYWEPRATAPSYIGGSLLMLVQIAVEATPRRRSRRPRPTIDTWTLLMIVVGSVVVALAFVVGHRLRLGS